MAIYGSLPKLGRFQLPTDPATIYALIDVDGRAMIAPNFSASATYALGDHVIYGDNLYRAKVAISTAGAWDSTKWDLVTVDSEVKRLEGLISGGIHYRGKTTTPLYDGATTTPITISGASVTPISGDLVILDLSATGVAASYATGVAYAIHTYIVNDSIYYITNAAISISENTSFTAISSKLDALTSDPEFLFDGTTWSALGSISDGLGDLAFKDDASGTYVKPTGSGTVSVNTYSANKQKLSTTTITGVDGAVSASEVSVKTTKSFAIRDAAATTVAVAAADATTVGNADVGDAIQVGTSLTGTTTFITAAIKDAELTGTTTFNTDAIKAASLTGTTTFATAGVTASVDGDCLILTPVSTGTVGISTTAASTASVGISTTAADATGTVGLGKTSITPAKAVSASSATVRGVSGTVSITGTSGTDTAITELTITAKTAAKAAASATTVATGSLETGDQIVTSLSSGTSTATVNVGTTTDTVVVK